jgi:hypothetical protein
VSAYLPVNMITYRLILSFDKNLSL